MRRKVFAFCLAALSLALLAGCGDGSADADAESTALNVPPPWAVSEEAQRGQDPEYGQALYAQTCITCHGPRGHGMPRQGGNIRDSEFVAKSTDEQLVDFLRKGRPAEHPENKLRVLMPARGGNAALDDTCLANIVAFLRKLQVEAREEEQQEEQDVAQDAEPASTQPVAGL